MVYVFEGWSRRPRGLAVLLTLEEMAWAWAVGFKRHNEALRMNLPDAHGFSGNGLAIHIAGARGELAVAKTTGIPWDATVNTFKRGGDVGDFQVKARSKSYYDLLIRDNDRPGDTFWLVTGTAPRLRVVGWIVARDGMKREYRAAHGCREEAWFVPQDVLRTPTSYKFN